MTDLRLTRFVATEDGGSRFVDHEVPFVHRHTDADGFVLTSSNRYPTQVTISELPEGLSQSWHNAPRRQIVVVLSGTVEVTTTDGSSRRFGPGQLFLADDTTGQGHLTRTVDGPARIFVAPVPAELDIDTWTMAG